MIFAKNEVRITVFDNGQQKQEVPTGSVFDNGEQEKELPTGFAADVEGKIRIVCFGQGNIYTGEGALPIVQLSIS